MYKLVRYLRPFTLPIAAAIALLFIQAMTDLALPGYMSNIVNIGIQRGGIENSVPNALRKNKMDEITAFMSPQDRDEVLKCYDLINEPSIDFDKHVGKYPALNNEPVFVIRDIDKSQFELIDPIISEALLAASMSEKPSRELSVSEITENDALGESMIDQTALSLVRAEYEALGMDSAKIQSDYIINTGMTMLLITLAGVVATIIVGLLSSRVAAGVARNIRKTVLLNLRMYPFGIRELLRICSKALISRRCPARPLQLSALQVPVKQLWSV